MQWYAAIPGLLLCSLLACSASVTPHGPNVEVSRSAVIVVGGYYGTKLSRVDNGELVWVTASQAFSGAQSLILPLPDLAFDGVALQPSGILDEVRVIPWCCSFEVYRLLLAELGRLHDGHVSIYPLNYDWRLDLMDAVRLLSAEIRRLKSQGITHVALVAHSMGGLIVSYYLRYGDQELEQAVETWEGTVYVEKVVMAGVPFLGSMWSFRNMQYGLKIGFNSSLLDQQVLASFPASYYTLPALGADVLLTPTQHLVRGAIHTAVHWRQQGWGLLKGTPVAPAQIVERRDAHTSYWLDRSQRFFDLLHAPSTTPNDRPIPLLYLYANGQRTLARGVWIPEEAGPHRANVVFDKDQFEKRLPHLAPTIVHEDGDGSVTVTSASLPQAYEKAFQFTTDRLQVGHMDVVTGREARRSIAGFLKTQ